MPKLEFLALPCRSAVLNREIHAWSVVARLLAIVVVLASFCGRDAIAQPASIEEIAQYQSPDRQAVLEAGAKREGHLMLYCNCALSEAVFQAFQNRYPYVKIDVLRNDVATTTRRVFEEYGAQNYLVDAVALTPDALQLLRDAGLLQSFQSPELAAIRADAIERGHHWVFDYQSFVSLGYNTKLISDLEAPKTSDDLLDPKWKGRMAISGSTTLSNWIGAVLREKDEGYLRKLAQQQIRIYQVAGRALANLVVSGEVPLSPTIYAAHMATSRAAGASVAWRAISGVYSDTDAVALARNAPHPNAAMLYIDSILSQEGQTLFQRLGYASARKDVGDIDRPAKIYYLNDEPDHLQNYEKWTALGREIFGR